MFRLLLLSFVVAFSCMGELRAQDRSVDAFHQNKKDLIDRYNNQVRDLKDHISGRAKEISDIIKCFESGKLYIPNPGHNAAASPASPAQFNIGTCSAVNVHNPEIDPRKSNHADKIINTGCASNETIEFSGGTWGCKEVRYKCSNPAGC